MSASPVMQLRIALLAIAALGSTCAAPSSAGTAPAPSWPAAVASPSAFASPSPPISGQTPTAVPIQALRRGGLYILMRHGADEGQDATPVDLLNCATQARLSDVGRQQLAAMAADVARLQVTVTKVVASPYCRTVETARIVFGGTPEVAEALQRPATPERVDVVVKVLGTVPAAGANIALVSHRDVIKAALGMDAALGEAFVVQPDGAGRFTVLGRIAIDRWKLPNQLQAP